MTHSFPNTQVPTRPYVRPSVPGPDVLRLDGNEGNQPDPTTLEALASAGTAVLRDYPDTSELQEEIAARFDVDPARVVITAGADDALDRLCRAYLSGGRQLVLPVPAFEMLYRFAQLAGGNLVTVPWQERFPVEGVIGALTEKTSLVAVVSPNNPTGRTITGDELLEVAAAASRSLVVLDHVYVEYADDDLTELASRLDNVVVVRTFSKAWGLAGCRIGYTIAAPEVAAVLRSAGNPYPVSGMSIAVVRGHLRRGDAALARHVSRIRDERQRLAERMAALGVSAPPAQGNFLLVDFGSHVEFVRDALATAGICVRFFPHRPEIATCLRITLPGNEPDFARLLTALEQALAPEALLFDLDGVLADVQESYRRCCIETARTFGVEITRPELTDTIHTGNANNDWLVTQLLLVRHGVEATLEEVTERFQQLYLGSPDTPGLRERERLLVSRPFLERLADDRPLAIVTGRPRDEAAWFLERAKIADLFRTVVTLEDGPNKPDPAPVVTAMQRLGVSRAWLVGDTPDDVRAARSAGVLPVGVVAPGDDTGRAGPALRAAGAAIVLDDIHALEDLIS